MALPEQMGPNVVVEQIGFRFGYGVVEKIDALSAQVISVLLQAPQQSVRRQHVDCHNKFLAQQPRSASFSLVHSEVHSEWTIRARKSGTNSPDEDQKGWSN